MMRTVEMRNLRAIQGKSLRLRNEEGQRKQRNIHLNTFGQRRKYLNKHVQRMDNKKPAKQAK